MRNEYTINLNTVADIKRFSQIIDKISYPVDVESGRYCVDAKSVMGLLSIDLSKDIRVIVRGAVEPMTAYALENFNQMTLDEM